MIIKNKLGINNSLILAREEERITKLKCKQLFDSNVLNQLEAGTFRTYNSYTNIYSKIYMNLLER